MSRKTKGDILAERRILAGRAIQLPLWTTAVPYLVNDKVVEAGIEYRCLTAHTSSAAFATDVANWSSSDVDVIPRATQAEIDALTGLLGGESYLNTDTLIAQYYTGPATVVDSYSGLASSGGSGLNASNTERGQQMPAPAANVEINSIDLKVGANNGSNDVRVRIYEGAALGGTILGEATTNLFNSAVQDVATFNFPSPVQLAAGNQWTIGIVRTSGTGVVTVFSIADYIAGGQDLFSPGNDWAMGVNLVTPSAGGGNTSDSWVQYPAPSGSLSYGEIFGLNAVATGTAGVATGAANNSISITTVADIVNFGAGLDNVVGSDIVITGSDTMTLAAGTYEVNLDATTNAPFAATAIHVLQLVQDGTTVIGASAQAATVIGDPMGHSINRTITVAAGTTLEVGLGGTGGGWRFKSIQFTVRKIG